MGGDGGWMTLSRVVRVVVVVLLSVCAAAPLGATALANPPDWAGDASPSTPDDDPQAPPFPGGATSAPLIEDEPGTPSTATAFPAPGRAADLDGTADGAASGPFKVVPTSAAARGVGLSVEVLDQTVAEQARVPGFVFRLNGAGGQGLLESLDAASDSAAEGAASVELSLEYESFADAYGGNFIDRMRVVALPACALSGPPFVEAVTATG